MGARTSTARGGSAMGERPRTSAAFDGIALGWRAQGAQKGSLRRPYAVIWGLDSGRVSESEHLRIPALLASHV